MGRPAIYSDEERLARVRASKAKYWERTREANRAKAAELRALPEYRERENEYRKALYRSKRQALLDSGWRPRRVGRPRIRTPEEAAEIHRRGNRMYMRRRRARERAQKALLEAEPAQVRSSDENDPPLFFSGDVNPITPSSS